MHILYLTTEKKISWKRLSLQERSKRWKNYSSLLKLVVSQITETRLTYIIENLQFQ